MAENTRIGFIGIGAMGYYMAARLHRAGYPVTVFDANPAQREKFAQAHNCRAAASLAELGAAADVVLTMLPNGHVVRHVFQQAENGALIQALARDSVVIDMSSSDPLGTRALAAALGARGVHLIDAPVSGGVTGAEAGTLTLMIGCDDPAILERMRPVLSTLGTRLFEAGRGGNGHAMKSLNNYVSGTAFMASLEALVIGAKFGLDPDVMVDILNESTGRNFSSVSTLKQEVISRGFGTRFVLGLLAKDVKIAADLADEIQINAPLSRMSRDLLARAREYVGEDADHTAAVKYWEMLNGLTVTRDPR